MTLKSKKIIARQWLTISLLLVTFPLSKYVISAIRDFQEAYRGIDTGPVTNLEVVVFILGVYILYLYFQSIIWAVKTLREPDEPQAHTVNRETAERKEA
jgi:hypothetical protein